MFILAVFDGNDEAYGVFDIDEDLNGDRIIGFYGIIDIDGDGIPDEKDEL